MGVVTYSMEFTSPIPSRRLFKALILDGDHLVAKLVPQAIKSVELIEGSGGPGTIKLINLAEGSHIKSLKHKVDGLDEENMKYRYSVVEGDALLEKMESISYEIKLESTPDGDCKGTNISHYHPKPGVEISEDQIKAGKEKAMAIFKAVEAYLLANPEAYSEASTPAV